MTIDEACEAQARALTGAAARLRVGWSQDWPATDVDGNGCTADDPDARAWSLAAALRMGLRDLPEHVATPLRDAGEAPHIQTSVAAWVFRSLAGERSYLVVEQTPGMTGKRLATLCERTAAVLMTLQGTIAYVRDDLNGGTGADVPEWVAPY